MKWRETFSDFLIRRTRQRERDENLCIRDRDRAPTKDKLIETNFWSVWVKRFGGKGAN